jgi:hypothetical protein
LQNLEIPKADLASSAGDAASATASERVDERGTYGAGRKNSLITPDFQEIN